MKYDIHSCAVVIVNLVVLVCVCVRRGERKWGGGGGGVSEGVELK